LRPSLFLNSGFSPIPASPQFRPLFNSGLFSIPASFQFRPVSYPGLLPHAPVLSMAAADDRRLMAAADGRRLMVTAERPLSRRRGSPHDRPAQ
jgi:hypothetical protein